MDERSPAAALPRILMIAYHFPPLTGSSGIQRTLSFVRDLPAMGWLPLILTAHCRAYEHTSPHTASGLIDNIPICRAFAMDSARHLAIFGRYPLSIALPDRWITWLLGALPAGLAMVRKHKPKVLWSTYPIATAHLIGYWLARLTGLPWIADFRDPMAHEGYPADPRTWQSFLRVEQRVFSRADLCVFATEGAARLYRQRYPLAAKRIRVIENGYDESAFKAAETGLQAKPLNPGAFTLLHSGIVYPEWRNPEHLFKALRSHIDAGELDPTQFKLRFRASQHETFLAEQTKARSLDDVVEILPPIPYHDALTEMLQADGLLLLQSAGCNDQIPAKLYEYLRARKPIMALTDPHGDTAQAVRAAGLSHIAPLDSHTQIASLLSRFIREASSGAAPVPSTETIHQASRRERAKILATMLDKISNSTA